MLGSNCFASLAAWWPPCAAPAQVSDLVHMLETMHETHVGHLIPRVQACHLAVEAFAEQCLECKVGGASVGGFP